VFIKLAEGSEVVQSAPAVREGLVCKAEAGEHPECHGEATVDEALDIDPKDTRVQLSTPAEVCEEGTVGACVLGRRAVQTFPVHEGGEREAKDVEHGNTRGEEIVHDPKVVEPLHGSGDEQSGEGEAVPEAVVDILWDMACFGHRAARLRAGKNSIEKQTKTCERKEKRASVR
jgi:hypothetical protein